MPDDDRDELAYYRAVEDLFAALRGVPHILSPKDFQLLRSWWREGVPLEAVSSGLTEVFARRSERGQPPVVSLRYCRHAVRTRARELADARVGGHVADDPDSAGRGPAEIASSLRRRGEELAADTPAVTRVLERFAVLVESAAGLPLAELDQHLFSLEKMMLDELYTTVDPNLRQTIDDEATRGASHTTDAEARERAYRAARDRSLRHHLELPRLELT